MKTVISRLLLPLLFWPCFLQAGEAVSFLSVRDIVSGWTQDQHLWTSGNVHVTAANLGELEAWLDENGKNWTVVLIESSRNQQYQGRSGMDAVEYALGKGLSNETTFSTLIRSFDHWIAFGLLALVGGKMLHEVYEEWKESPDACACPVGDEEKKRDLSSKRIVLLLAIATSIDALATGIVFVSFSTQILLQGSFIIGLVSFVFSLAGNYIGVYFGKKFTFRIEIVGGIILLLIGLKIFIEHMYQS